MKVPERPKRLAWWSKVMCLQCLPEPLQYFDAVWHLREREQDLRQADRDASVAHYRPVLSVTDEERQAYQEKQCALWWKRCYGVVNAGRPIGTVLWPGGRNWS